MRYALSSLQQNNYQAMALKGAKNKCDLKSAGNAQKKSIELFSADKPIELGLQGAPAAADFDGPDAAFGDILEEGGS